MSEFTVCAMKMGFANALLRLFILFIFVAFTVFLLEYGNAVSERWETCRDPFESVLSTETHLSLI